MCKGTNDARLGPFGDEAGVSRARHSPGARLASSVRSSGLRPFRADNLAVRSIHTRGQHPRDGRNIMGNGLLRLLTGILCAALGVATAAPFAFASSQATDAALQTSDALLASAMTTDLATMAKKDSASDGRYYENGQWVWDDLSCFRCSVGPGLAAASVANATGSSTALAEAIATFDRAIADHRLSSGAFGPPGPGENGPDIQTAFFGEQLGQAYLLLNNKLDAAHRSSWLAALKGCADFLIRNGNLTWYSNGNLALVNTLVVALTAKATGDATYTTAYQSALQFAMTPTPATKWAGDGLHYTTVPAKADGSDGSGYLAEAAGSGTPGFDADYTQVQLSMAATLFHFTGDQTALRLANLLFNQLLPRLDTGTFSLSTSGGTRHPQAGRVVGFDTPALSILALEGGRTDLIPLLSGQVQHQRDRYGYVFAESTPALGEYQSIGSDGGLTLAVIDGALHGNTPTGAASAPAPAPAAAATTPATGGGASPSVTPAPKQSSSLQTLVLTASASKVVPGHLVELSATVSPIPKSTLGARFQYYANGRWVTLASRHSNAEGVFLLGQTPVATRSYRAFVITGVGGQGATSITVTVATSR
jgi:hypothetical protein